MLGVVVVRVCAVADGNSFGAEVDGSVDSVSVNGSLREESVWRDLPDMVGQVRW